MIVLGESANAGVDAPQQLLQAMGLGGQDWGWRRRYSALLEFCRRCGPFRFIPHESANWGQTILWLFWGSGECWSPHYVSGGLM